MKNQFWLLLLAVVFLVTGMWFWRQPVKYAVFSALPAQTAAQSSNRADVISSASNTNIMAPKNPTVSMPQPQIQTTNSRLEKLKGILESKDVPVSFYGRVVDQDGNGIAGVQILMSVRQWGLGGTFDSWGNKFPKFNCVTDSNGSFSLEGTSGDSLTVESVFKNGYSLSPKTQMGYGYGESSAPHHPDRQNPIIIKMWKLGEKAQLIAGSKFWGIIPDGRTYTMDFFKQMKFEGDNALGDIRVKIMRPAQVKPRVKFDWSFEIEGIQGGVIQSQDEFMYLAPETGYQKFEFSMSTNNPSWKREIDGMQFYFQSRNGSIYGQFIVDVIPDYNEQSIFNIKFSVNPNGSRNLQP